MPWQTRKTWKPPEGKYITVEGRKVFITKKERSKAMINKSVKQITEQIAIRANYVAESATDVAYEINFLDFEEESKVPHLYKKKIEEILTNLQKYDSNLRDLARIVKAISHNQSHPLLVDMQMAISEGSLKDQE
mgnify:CR=1 FL=1